MVSFNFSSKLGFNIDTLSLERKHLAKKGHAAHSMNCAQTAPWKVLAENAGCLINGQDRRLESTDVFLPPFPQELLPFSGIRSTQASAEVREGSLGHLKGGVLAKPHAQYQPSARRAGPVQVATEPTRTSLLKEHRLPEPLSQVAC